MNAALDPSYWIGVFTLIGIWGIFVLGLQLNAGLTGLLNFGHAGVMAVGAYTMAILVVRAHWPFALAIVTALVAAVLASVAMGLVTAGLRKDYFAIASLAMAELVISVAQNARSFSGGAQGIFGYDGAWYSFSRGLGGLLAPLGGDDEPLLPLMLVSWVTFLFAAAALGLLARTGWGRVLRAIREDEDATRSLGKNVLRFKLQSLAISGALGAVAGWLLAFSLGLLAPNQFDATFTFLGYAALILGGMGTFRGAILGTGLLWLLLEGTRLISLPLDASQTGALRYMIVGLVLMTLIAVRPQGLMGNREELHLE